MTISEADQIIESYERFIDRSCTCFQGHPPCGYCENCPSEDLYKEAKTILREEQNCNDLAEAHYLEQEALEDNDDN